MNYDKSDERDLVTLSNDMIKAGYKLTVNEIRLILIAIAQMPKGDKDKEPEPLDPMKPYYITKEDFVKMGVEPNNVAREIRSACSDLLKREVYIDTPIGVLGTHWVHNILHFKTKVFEELKQKYPNSKYDDEFLQQLKKHNLLDTIPVIAQSDDNIMARVIFHADIIPYISQLRQHFTQLKLTEMAGFSSFYSFRVYILMMQWRDTGFIIIRLDEFRKMLDLVEKYPAIKDLKKWVLDTALKEINDKSPYNADYEVTDKNGKSGKGIKLTHLKIKFKLKTKAIEGKTTNKTERDPNTIDWVNGQTDNEASGKTDPIPSWQTKGLSDGQIKKIAIYTKEFVDANSSKIAPNDRRDYAPIFDDWKPLLKDPKTVNSFKKVQELLDRQRI